MNNIKRRIERAEAKVESITMDASDREAKLQELKRLQESGDNVAVLMLAAELEYGPNWSLAKVLADAAKRLDAKAQK